MKMPLKLFLVSICLLGLALSGARLFSHAPALPETLSDEPLPPTPKIAVEPAVDRSRRTAPKESPEARLAEPLALTRAEPPEDPDDLREWTRQNYRKAWAWMLNAPADSKRDVVAEIICAKVAESDPAQAVALAEGYAGGCSNLLENLVQQWADQDEPAAAAYAMIKLPGEERDRLTSRVAFARSKKDPVAAAKLVVEQISPGEVQNEAAISVLHQWALRDPSGAAAWAQLFPSGGLRDRALKEVENIYAIAQTSQPAIQSN